MNNVNQVTPDGTISYSQTGTYKWTDPYTGRTYDIPKTTATTQLSAAQQAIKDQTDGAQLNLGTLANNQSAFLNDYMSKPFDGSNDATEARLIELGNKRLQPMLDQRRTASETDLINRGIRPGSTNYNQAQTNISNGENDAYNQLLLNGHGQAFAEGQAIRNQPINEITALLSGSQVSMPQAAGYNQSQIPTTDVAGLINNNYNQQFAAYQQKAAQQQQLMGGLFGMGASLISDRRAKTDIKRVGTADNGIPLYAYRYAWGGPMMIGVMSDEVPAGAVSKHPSGFDQVDYGKVF